MNTQEACNIMGVQPGTSKEEIDKAFKKLALKYHPDRNKDADAESKFKKMNEAYQYLKTNGSDPMINLGNNFHGGFPNSGFGMDDFLKEFFTQNVSDFSGPFRRTNINFNNRANSIKGTINLSFIESVTGCTKNVSITRKVKCSECNGTGAAQTVGAPCKRCKGSKKVQVNGKDLPCTGCGGSGLDKNYFSCSSCSGKRVLEETNDVIVSIPPGVQSGITMKIPDSGDFINGRYDNAYFKVTVENDTNFTRINYDIVSEINISLLDAVKGASKEVNTCYGKKTLKIKPGIKHGESIRVRGFGVGNDGFHIFKINIDYPINTKPLIEFLESYSCDDIEDMEEIEGE